MFSVMCLTVESNVAAKESLIPCIILWRRECNRLGIIPLRWSSDINTQGHSGH